MNRIDEFPSRSAEYVRIDAVMLSVAARKGKKTQQSGISYRHLVLFVVHTGDPCQAPRLAGRAVLDQGQEMS